jgi:hypothetical protein
MAWGLAGSSLNDSMRKLFLRAKGSFTFFPALFDLHPCIEHRNAPRSRSQYQLKVPTWSFDPDYEMISSLLVHSRTGLTFLPDPASATSVQSSLH